jgi:hypothetical protein
MRSWARQRLVAASSRRTEEKVASRRGSGRHCRRASRARALSLSLLELAESSQELIEAIPEKTAHNMLQETGCLLLNKLRYHVAENSSNCIEPFVRSADIIQPMIIEEDLLDNEYCDGLAELGASLHNSKTEGDDLCGQQEVDNVGGVVLDKCSNDTQGCQSQVFEGPRFRGCVQEGVEEERNMGCEN